jgi:glycine cleavage system H protein
MERQMKPTVRLITPATQESGSQHEFNVPAGVFVSHNHTWVGVELNGTARVGIDDFARKTLGRIDGVELPKPGTTVRKGAPLFSLKHDSQTFTVSSPISGKVALVNAEHAEHPEWIASKPFELSWMCCIEPTELAEELHSLKIGADSITWYREEIDRYSDIVKESEKESAPAQDDKVLQQFARTFLQGTPAF